MEVAEPKTVAS